MNKKDIFLSIIIPAHNEGDCIGDTCTKIIDKFSEVGIEDYEIIVVNDNSSDTTETALQSLCRAHSVIEYVNNDPPFGFGFAVRKGLLIYHGEAVAIVMADLSDSPADIIVYYNKLKEGHECVFGSRFIKGSKVKDYPFFKLFLNRIVNIAIKLIFGIKFNDVTNAFKAYRREVISSLEPIISPHFNLTVELPLKAIVRGFDYIVVPIAWSNRKKGESKLKIKEMGSRYLFIILYCFIEKLFSQNDFHRTTQLRQLRARQIRNAGYQAQSDK